MEMTTHPSQSLPIPGVGALVALSGEPKIRVWLTIPEKDRDHQPVNPSVRDALVNEIGRKCGGYSLLEGEGKWFSPSSGEYHTERPSFLFIDVEPDIALWIFENRTRWCQLLGQEELFVSFSIIYWLGREDLCHA